MHANVQLSVQEPIRTDRLEILAIYKTSHCNIRISKRILEPFVRTFIVVNTLFCFLLQLIFELCIFTVLPEIRTETSPDAVGVDAVKNLDESEVS